MMPPKRILDSLHREWGELPIADRDYKIAEQIVLIKDKHEAQIKEEFDAIVKRI